MSEFKAQIVSCVLPVHIKAPVGKVFPLCCPVEEYRWIPGWKCDLIHCPNDKVELGTVFDEIAFAPFLLGSFRGKTRWTVVAHDPNNYRIHFQLDSRSSSSLFKIELADDASGGTAGRMDFTYTATTKRGNRLAKRHMEVKIRTILSVINAMLQHYCETGTMMAREGIQKLVLSERELSLMDKVLIGLNRIAMSKMKDKDRGRFMRKYYGART